MEPRHIATVSEREILLELVDKYKYVLENKKNDVRNIEKKRTTWEILKLEFNSHPNVTQRTAQQLKKMWTNIKMHAKRSYFEIKREKGDVDSPAEEDMDENLSKVLALIPRNESPNRDMKPNVKKKNIITQQDILRNELKEHYLRMEILEMQKRQMEEKYEVEMRFMREMHDFKMRHLEEKYLLDIGEH